MIGASPAASARVVQSPLHRRPPGGAERRGKVFVAENAVDRGAQRLGALGRDDERVQLVVGVLTKRLARADHNRTGSREGVEQHGLAGAVRSVREALRSRWDNDAARLPIERAELGRGDVEPHVDVRRKLDAGEVLVAGDQDDGAGEAGDGCRERGVVAGEIASDSEDVAVRRPTLWREEALVDSERTDVHASRIGLGLFEQPLPLRLGEADHGVRAAHGSGQERVLSLRGPLEPGAEVDVQQDRSQARPQLRRQGDDGTYRRAEDVRTVELPGKRELACVPGQAGQRAPARLRSLQERLGDRGLDSVSGQVVLAQ